MKLDLLIKDMKILVLCKCEMLSLNRALVITNFVWVVFLFVQTVFRKFTLVVIATNQIHQLGQNSYETYKTT